MDLFSVYDCCESEDDAYTDKSPSGGTARDPEFLDSH